MGREPAPAATGLAVGGLAWVGFDLDHTLARLDELGSAVVLELSNAMRIDCICHRDSLCKAERDEA